ncbi:hypothetical protein VNO80_10143 [Phaseolus coccineus]|uniref:Uncharacterized protein n=1 Tax=Phaseolus coccineus TaxID=3886 RepID=A0AAN9RD72_PHACN
MKSCSSGFKRRPARKGRGRRKRMKSLLRSRWHRIWNFRGDRHHTASCAATFTASRATTPPVASPQSRPSLQSHRPSRALLSSCAAPVVPPHRQSRPSLQSRRPSRALFSSGAAPVTPSAPVAPPVAPSAVASPPVSRLSRLCRHVLRPHHCALQPSQPGASRAGASLPL